MYAVILVNVSYTGRMPRRTQSKQNMVSAARLLFKQNGYAGTAFADILEASEAPRGSVYFHFPGGKEELGQEVVLADAAAATLAINRDALESSAPGELISRYLLRIRDELVKNQFRYGCAFAPLVIEQSAVTEGLRAVTRTAFADISSTLAARLTESGVPAIDARELASATMAAFEGCLIVARAQKDASCFETMARLLSTQANAAASAAGGR